MVKFNLDIDGFMKNTIYPAAAKIGRERMCEAAKQRLRAELLPQIAATEDDEARADLEALMQTKLLDIDKQYRSAELHLIDSESKQELGVFKRGDDK